MTLPSFDLVKKTLLTDPEIRLVGVAATCKEAVRIANTFKPDLVVLDLSMPGRENFGASLVKSQLLGHARQLITVSFRNDEEANALSADYGASALPDKMNLATELLPAIRNFS